jgi:hypothetical protein
MTQYSIPLNIEEEYIFSNEETLTATEKWQILQDWQHFMLSGFKQLFFTRVLYRQLLRCDLTAHRNAENFWGDYFASEISRSRSILRMWGGDHVNPESGNTAWLGGPTADLKAAMCQEAERLYLPLTQILQDLEMKYEELVEAWHHFATAANITDAVLPPHYQVSDNARNLLAFAAQIALKQERPLVGLQMMFPLTMNNEQLAMNNFEFTVIK